MERQIYLELIQRKFEIVPICAILGPRQVGKTTLARQYAERLGSRFEFFDLEDPSTLSSLQNPMLTLGQFDDILVIIDEIQLRPELFPTLRVLVDHPTKKYRFLILGSASRDLIQQSSETLAGRIGYIELPPFTLQEVGDSNKLWERGGFPRSYLAPSAEASLEWRKDYITTFLERDLRALGFDIPPEAMRRFWMMLSFYHGNIFNASEIAHSLMISHKSVTRYLDILSGTFMVRQLYPWYENIKKRQVRSYKIYIRDSGIFNALTDTPPLLQLVKTPRVGALWEGFALEQIINQLNIRAQECYFWSTHNEAELDLLLFIKGNRIGFEFKYTDSPKVTKSMHIALQDLQLDHLYLIYPGTRVFPMEEKITACGLEKVASLQLLSLPSKAL